MNWARPREDCAAMYTAALAVPKRKRVFSLVSSGIYFPCVCCLTRLAVFFSRTIERYLMRYVIWVKWATTQHPPGLIQQCIINGLYRWRAHTQTTTLYENKRVLIQMEILNIIFGLMMFACRSPHHSYMPFLVCIHLSYIGMQFNSVALSWCLPPEWPDNGKWLNKWTFCLWWTLTLVM